MKHFWRRTASIDSKNSRRPWLLAGPWIILVSVGIPYILQIHRPVTPEEWWGLSFMALGWIGMVLLQIAVWVRKTPRLVQPRKR